MLIKEQIDHIKQYHQTREHHRYLVPVSWLEDLEDAASQNQLTRLLPQQTKKVVAVTTPEIAGATLASKSWRCTSRVLSIGLLELILKNEAYASISYLPPR